MVHAELRAALPWQVSVSDDLEQPLNGLRELFRRGPIEPPADAIKA
jgi:hypothetical protein